MKRAISILTGLCLGFVLSLSLATPAAAQEKAEKKKGEKKEAKAKEDRLSGTVHMINKDTSTITIRRGNIQRQIVYSNDTKFTYRNKPASLDDVKDGRRIIALGKFNDKTQLVASRIDVREGK